MGAVGLNAVFCLVLIAAAMAAGWPLALSQPARNAVGHPPLPARAFFSVNASPDTQLAAGEARKAAREAQRAFERTRRRNLSFWNGPTGRCDEIIGRFCVWHDGDPEYDPPPERERVRAAREELIDVLGTSAGLAPDDGWILGHWIHYLIEDGRREEAREAVASCSAETWWCGALAGYALHALGAYAAADSAFAAALRRMPAAERCRWRDLRHLLDGDLHDAYEKLSCEERTAMEERIWLLADPLYMVPGNDRRTEHFSRRVLDRIHGEAESPYGVAWGPDLEEILVRYGWPASWSRRREPVYSPRRRRPSITGHDPERSFRFLPPSDLMDDLDFVGQAEWELEPRRPREEYLPRYASFFDGEGNGFDYQLAVFRRGGFALIVGAYQWLNDSLTLDTPLRVGLVHSGERGGPRAAISESAPGRGVLTARTPSEPAVLGIEALADSARRAARVRIGRRSPGSELGPALSDILLLELPPAGSPPATLEEVLAHARPSTTVRPGERIALLWELYGVSEGTPVEVEVSLTKPGKSFFRRVAEWLGLAEERDPSVSLEWREESVGGPAGSPRYLELEIPELSGGRYALSASVVAVGSRVISVRALRVVDR